MQSCSVTDFDLALLLLEALATGETAELEAFIDTHLAELADYLNLLKRLRGGGARPVRDVL